MRKVLMVAVALVVAGSGGAEAQVPTARDFDVAAGAAACALDAEAHPFGVPGCSLVPGRILLPSDVVAPAHASPFDPGMPPAFPQTQERGSRARLGAVVGAVIGGVTTYVLLHQGGSTSLCDRSANQDAMGRRECAGLTVAGAAAGAALGAWVGSRIRR